MSDVAAIVLILLIFLGIMIVFSRENMDYVAYSILGAVISVLITSTTGALTPDASCPVGCATSKVLNMIEFEPLLFILSMQIIVVIAEKHKIFQWVAVKTLHITKGDHRKFFYLICTISTIVAAIIADVTVSIIFVPLTIRACRILNIKPAPFLFGITITINIGSIMTPFSSSENILIALTYQKDLPWFMANFIPFFIIALFFTLFLLDRMMLKNMEPPTEAKKQILLEIMDPAMVYVNRKEFLQNSLYFGAVILGFVIFSSYSFVVALIGAVIISLLNKTSIEDTITKIDWKVIMFFISLFLIIGCLEALGFFITVADGVRKLTTDSLLVGALVILILSSLLSGALANSPTAIVFISLINNVYGDNPANIIIIAFLLGINLGGNILPQGAACDVMTLNIATKNKVEGFTYKTLLKRGGTFAAIHIVLCILYIIFYYFIT